MIRWAKHGTLRLQGVGHIKCRGKARAAGIIKSCELMHASGEWHVSLTIECADADVKRERREDRAMGADWGVSRLLTIVRTDGPHGEAREDIENPRWCALGAWTRRTKRAGTVRGLKTRNRPQPRDGGR